MFCKVLMLLPGIWAGALDSNVSVLLVLRDKSLIGWSPVKIKTNIYNCNFLISLEGAVSLVPIYLKKSMFSYISIDVQFVCTAIENEPFITCTRVWLSTTGLHYSLHASFEGEH